MPELPEVETARRGIEPHLLGRRVTAVTVRDRRLRWPVPPALKRELTGQRITQVARRGKYLLLRTDSGTAILHLGMSGSLRVVMADTPPGKHDHVDLVLEHGCALRLRDPRRFGSLLWTRGDALAHALLKDLGPEPLEAEFDGGYLFDLSRGRSVAVKNFLMDSHVVVGVGNIYASEALFLAGIHPKRAAGRVSRASYVKLAKGVRRVLSAAIKAGGTTLRDFSREDGEPGYFSQHLRVYGRDGKACERCGGRVIASVIGQRNSYYCPKCQS
jgi:formamidopyrimidine-DNA glycosylase